MKIIKNSFFCTILLVCFLTKSFGQSTAKDSTKLLYSFWDSVGLGTSSLGSLAGLATINAELADYFVISASATGESSSFLFSNADVTTVNVLAGRAFKAKYFLLTVSAGLGYDYVSTANSPNTGLFGDNSRTNKVAIGAPVLVQCYVVPLPGLAIGVGAYANLNADKTTAGITTSIAFGPIRRKKIH